MLLGTLCDIQKAAARETRRIEDGLRYLAFLSSLPMNSCTPEALKVMLDWTIRNDDF